MSTIPGHTYRMSNCSDDAGKRMPEWDGMIVRCIGRDDYLPLMDRPDYPDRGAFMWPANTTRFIPVNMPDLRDLNSVVKFLLSI